MQLHDGIGISYRNLFDVHSTLSREHQEMFFLRPIKTVRGVILVFDITGIFNPDAFDHMALDIHTQNVPGMYTRLIRVVGQFDTTGLSAPAHLNLGFHHNGVTGCFSNSHRFIHRVRDTSRANRNVVAGEVLLALVFE